MSNEPQRSDFDDAQRETATKALMAAGLWVKRTFWTDENDIEYPEGHPQAINRVSMLEIDYRRIVDLVAESLACDTPTGSGSGSGSDPRSVT